ncbi:MAG: hypothetical protein Q9217_001412 [Psora testacea]
MSHSQSNQDIQSKESSTQSANKEPPTHKQSVHNRTDVHVEGSDEPTPRAPPPRASHPPTPVPNPPASPDPQPSPPDQQETINKPEDPDWWVHRDEQIEWIHHSTTFCTSINNLSHQHGIEVSRAAISLINGTASSLTLPPEELQQPLSSILQKLPAGTSAADSKPARTFTLGRLLGLEDFRLAREADVRMRELERENRERRKEVVALVGSVRALRLE